MNRNYQTEQENFWAGSFGDEYIARNIGDEYLASNLHFFSDVFRVVQKPESIIEFGANVGMNLKAIRLLLPKTKLFGVEINEKAASELAEVIGKDHVFNETIFDFNAEEKYDVSLIKGVLIHINPEKLPLVYEKLYRSSKKYIVIAEYYNPTPVTINYRGHENRLFKRDFCSEIRAQYPDLTLIDYGFCYRNDPEFPQDDITWFLLEKHEL